jgi:hypothetical protein
MNNSSYRAISPHALPALLPGAPKPTTAKRQFQILNYTKQPATLSSDNAVPADDRRFLFIRGLQVAAIVLDTSFVCH